MLNNPEPVPAIHTMTKCQFKTTMWSKKSLYLIENVYKRKKSNTFSRPQPCKAWWQDCCPEYHPAWNPAMLQGVLLFIGYCMHLRYRNERIYQGAEDLANKWEARECRLQQAPGNLCLFWPSSGGHWGLPHSRPSTPSPYIVWLYFICLLKVLKKLELIFNAILSCLMGFPEPKHSVFKSKKPGKCFLSTGSVCIVRVFITSI